MTIKQLIELLEQEDPNDEVRIEQINDQGPEGVSQVESYGQGVTVIIGDMFK